MKKLFFTRYPHRTRIACILTPSCMREALSVSPPRGVLPISLSHLHSLSAIDLYMPMAETWWAFCRLMSGGMVSSHARSASSSVSGAARRALFARCGPLRDR